MSSYFFDGLEGATEAGGLPHGGTNRTAIDLVRNFLALEDEFLRGAVSGLLKALREHDATTLTPPRLRNWPDRRTAPAAAGC